MSYNIKSLIVVLFLAGVCFVVMKPYITKFMAEEDFIRRRNLWIIITISAFAIPNYWAFTILMLIVLYRFAGRDSNVAALYLFVMHAMPPASAGIPVVGIQYLFDMSSSRTLALAVLLPASIRLHREMKEREAGGGSVQGFAVFDLIVLLFAFMQVARFPPLAASPDFSLTIFIRRAFVVWMDVWLVYYVFSRTLLNKKLLLEAIAALAAMTSILALVGMFESVRGWLLYAQIKTNWTSTPATYVMRDGLIRAEVSTGIFLQLGFVCALGFGAWLFLGTWFKPTLIRLLGSAWMWLGLLAAWSRGPWIVAVGMFLVNAFLQKSGFSKLFKAVLVLVLCGLGVLISPMGDRMMRLLPWVGTVENENVEYRERLAERSWQLLWEHPWFGDPLVTRKMEDLRQGQGIIDFVNGYSFVSLFYGLVGLSFFLLPGLIAMLRVRAVVSRAWSVDPEIGRLGACLLTAMVGNLVMGAVAGFGSDYLWYNIVLAMMVGLIVSERGGAAGSVAPAAPLSGIDARIAAARQRRSQGGAPT